MMARLKSGAMTPALLLGGMVTAVMIFATAAAETPSTPAAYVKKDTWPETMLATRQAVRNLQEKSDLKLGPWHTTGPLAATGFDDALFPEKSVDLDAKGPDGNPLWQERTDWADGQVHHLDGSHRASTYLFRTVTASRATTIAAGLGSDDGLAVWLNGKQLLANNVARGPAPDQDRVELTLEPGVNKLLLKIHNNGGGHGFYFALGETSVLPGVWEQMEKDFPVQAEWMRRYAPDNRQRGWFQTGAGVDLEKEILDRAIRDLGHDGDTFQGSLDGLTRSETPPDDPRWLALFERVCRFRHRPTELRQVNLRALRMAIEDLVGTYPREYSRGRQYLDQLADCERQVAEIEMALARGDGNAARRVPGVVDCIERLRRDALLSNPLLDFGKLLVLKRKADRLGLPQNWQGNCAMSKTGYDNEIDVLSPVRPEGRLSTLYKPSGGEFVGDVDLHFDADRMLFSMPGSNGRWQIWEMGADGKNLRQVTPGEHPDVDNYDACYLPDGRIIFDSTRCFAGVPCVGGGNTVANLCLMDADGESIRQLCFDQDHDWCPTVLNNGRVLYSRWEYSDLPHYFSRLLFHMNPDGTGQMEYYASNSMWPNSIFYARPIPNHPTKVVAVISGHHGVPRMGELVLFDPAVGRREADGAVQRIPGHGRKVDPVIQDGLVNGSWPKFLHPYPLSDKYFLVAAQPTQNDSWGIYLVDVFDNMLLVKEEPGYALLEPVPLRPVRKPPVIVDRVDTARDDATVYLTDIYRGDGLKDVPRGTVKALRVYSPHYAYPGMGGHINIGIDGPWDVHRILGTVPVRSDGSAAFSVPANTPLAVQPLDADGKALQIMRSWFVAMPGEVLSCVGCHESQNTGPPSAFRTANYSRPVEITPWHGPPRGFSFTREVQPVLDRYCVGCHDGRERDRPNFTADRPSPFRRFTPSYCELHPFVRRPGPESDYHLQQPLEFHASTSELVQMLEKGHYNVKLDREAWDRLITWIDLNVPDFGTWHEHRGGHSPWEERRLEMRTCYANRPENPEDIPGENTEAEGEAEAKAEPEPIAFLEPEPLAERRTRNVTCPGWPFDAGEANRRQDAAAKEIAKPSGDDPDEQPAPSPEIRLELADGVTFELVLIPAGEFVMGDTSGDPAAPSDEYPPARVKIAGPFYLGKFEVTNEQYALFDAAHDSAYISMTNKDQNHRGHAVNNPRQPVVRINWEEAVAFCRWLSQETGRRCSLPTEAQWEWACRAGTATPLWYGNVDSDFSRRANLADANLERFAQRDSPKWHPRVDRFNDGLMVTGDVGRYESNPWGLADMHGNAAEWTLSSFRPYPYNPRDGRDRPGGPDPKVVRGGSWFDRPHRARSGFRLAYPSWQRVYNVGFRVAMEAK